MAKLVFYQQRRMDGGTRTGIEVDGEIAYGLYEPGESEDNPRLRWFVDLRCDGPKLPESHRSARAWLLKHGQMIRNGFLRCAEEVRAGIDPDVYSISWDAFEEVPPGVQMKIVLTAARREDAIGMAEVVREIGTDWDRLVRMLRPAQTAHR
jgi:hypothetical protein